MQLLPNVIVVPSDVTPEKDGLVVILISLGQLLRLVGNVKTLICDKSRKDSDKNGDTNEYDSLDA